MPTWQSPVAAAVEQSIYGSQRVRPWVVAANNTCLNDAADVTAAGNERRESRQSMQLGPATCQSLRFVFGNWWCDIGAGGQETNTGNAVLLDAALEYSGAVLRITFGGSSSYTLADGETVISDPVSPSAFGLAAFPAGANIFCRTGMECAVGGKIPRSGQYMSVAPNGKINMASGAASQIMATGTLSGTIGQAGGPILVIGRFTSPIRSVIAITDSIGRGNSDTSDITGAGGGGYIKRGIYSIGAHNTPFANLGRHGGSLNRYYTVPGSATRRRALYQYCSTLWIAYGANDLFNPAGTMTIPDNFLSYLSQERALAQTAGVRSFVCSTVAPRTSSTDAWATLANQSPQANWRVSDIAYVNAAIKADTGWTSVIDVNAAWGYGGAESAWIVNGTANYPTGDGTHPSAALNAMPAAAIVAAANVWATR